MNISLKPFALGFLGVVLAACASAPKVEPSSGAKAAATSDLATIHDYEGHWEIARCFQGGKQAQRLRIEVKDDNEILMSRWQWDADAKPQFTAKIQPGQQTLAEFQSEDMISRNPVVNKTHWTWMDQRIVGNLQWLPGEGDERGNWSAVAMGHFHVASADKDKMIWTRWGTTHSDRHGKQDWTSKCEYQKIQSQGRGLENAVDFSKAQVLQTTS